MSKLFAVLVCALFLSGCTGGSISTYSSGFDEYPVEESGARWLHRTIGSVLMIVGANLTRLLKDVRRMRTSRLLVMRMMVGKLRKLKPEVESFLL